VLASLAAAAGTERRKRNKRSMWKTVRLTKKTPEPGLRGTTEKMITEEKGSEV